MIISYAVNGEYKEIDLGEVRDIVIKDDAFKMSALLPRKGSHNDANFYISVYENHLESNATVDVRLGELDKDRNWWHWKNFCIWRNAQGRIRESKDTFTKKEYNETRKVINNA